MGPFIVFEGLDGAGTTTQCGRLKHWFDTQNRPAHSTFEPSDGPVGRLIRDTLAGRMGAPDPSVLPWFFAADRADHLVREIEPALSRGAVLCDRYIPSSLAYQSLSLPLDEVIALNARFRVPDLILFLEIPPEIALQRLTRRGSERELFERLDPLTRIAERYDQVMRRLLDEGQPVVRIDGTQEVEAVHEGVLSHVIDRLG